MTREEAIDVLQHNYPSACFTDLCEAVEIAIQALSAQPEPLSDAYMKAVYAWLLNYQIKAAEMEGRYIPCEVLSWVANDWRKENEIN